MRHLSELERAGTRGHDLQIADHSLSSQGIGNFCSALIEDDVMRDGLRAALTLDVSLFVPNFSHSAVRMSHRGFCMAFWFTVSHNHSLQPCQLPHQWLQHWSDTLYHTQHCTNLLILTLQCCATASALLGNLIESRPAPCDTLHWRVCHAAAQIRTPMHQLIGICNPCQGSCHLRIMSQSSQHITWPRPGSLKDTSATSASNNSPQNIC